MKGEKYGYVVRPSMYAMDILNFAQNYISDMLSTLMSLPILMKQNR